MGEATQLPYTAPGPNEDDPGQRFNFSFLGRSLGTNEIEVVVFNGDEATIGKTTVTVEESPFTDDEKFLLSLYQGLFDRQPEVDELADFYSRLTDGSITRTDLIEELRSREEFTKARDILLAQKTLYGDWRQNHGSD